MVGVNKLTTLNKSKFRTDAQVGAVTGVVLADEDLATVSLRVLAEALGARSSADPGDVSSLSQMLISRREQHDVYVLTCTSVQAEASTRLSASCSTIYEYSHSTRKGKLTV